MSRRVLHVLEATEGGTRTHLRDLVLRLQRMDWQVDVAVSDERDPSFADDLALFQSAGVGIYIVKMQRRIAPLADWRAFCDLWTILRQQRYDLVHTHSSKAGFVGRLAARVAGVPALCTPNAFRFQAPDAGGFERWLVVRLERLAASWGSGIICVSEGEREAALEARIDRAERLHLVPNGIDLAPLDAAAGRGGGRDALALRAEAWPIVLTIGRRVPQKGDRYLLEAWPEVVRAFPDAQLVIVGDGPLLDDLQQLATRLGIDDSVCFPARQGDVGRLYAMADVYVLPSLYEGCPYSLLEAMALGRTCVATAVAGSRDIIADGQTGLLVPAADPPALAAALLRALSDHDLRVKLGEQARHVARRDYTADRMAAATVALYDETLRSRLSTSGGE